VAFNFLLAVWFILINLKLFTESLGETLKPLHKYRNKVYKILWQYNSSYRRNANRHSLIKRFYKRLSKNFFLFLPFSSNCLNNQFHWKNFHFIQDLNYLCLRPTIKCNIANLKWERDFFFAESLECFSTLSGAKTNFSILTEQENSFNSSQFGKSYYIPWAIMTPCILSIFQIIFPLSHPLKITFC